MVGDPVTLIAMPFAHLRREPQQFQGLTPAHGKGQLHMNKLNLFVYNSNQPLGQLDFDAISASDISALRAAAKSCLK